EEEKTTEKRKTFHKEGSKADERPQRSEAPRHENRNNPNHNKPRHSRNDTRNDNKNSDNRSEHRQHDNRNDSNGNSHSHRSNRSREYEFDGVIVSEGVLEIMPDGYGFLRSSDYNYL